MKTALVRQTVGPDRTLAMYLAVPGRTRGRKPAVLVVHDAAGLDAQTQAIARHVAGLGFVACAPDLLGRLGGSPADAAAARIMTARLDRAQAEADGAATAAWLSRNPAGERVLTGRVAAIGLGWGAPLVEELLATPGPLVAAVLSGAPSRPPAAAPAGDVPVLRLAPAALDGDEAGSAWSTAAAFLRDHLRPTHSIAA